jgi:hypothetical protein
MDNARNRSCSPTFPAFAAHNVPVITFPPQMAHAMQPIGVSWAPWFKAFLRDWLRIHNQPEGRRADRFMRLGLPLERASQAQIIRRGRVFVYRRGSSGDTNGIGNGCISTV